MSSRWKFLQLWFLPLAFFSPARAALYEAVLPNTLEVLRLNIPDSLKVVRGIYLWGNGGTGDGRNRATDPEMLAVADMLGFAVIACSGVVLDYTDSTTDVAGFEAALAELARMSGHPEIVRAPILPIGHSNGGNTAYGLNVALSQRVLATELSKSGNCAPLPSLAALRTPAILIAGEVDTPERIANIRARFFDNRPRGALWAWVEEQGTDHTQLDGPEIAWPFAEMIARQRYPANASPVNGAVPLIVFNEADGWLTDPNSYKTGLADIAPYATYAKDKSVAGWLPNRRAAYLFRAFASYDKATATATISPSGRLVDPGAAIVYTLGEPLAPWRTIDFYEGDGLLKTAWPGDADALSVSFSTMTTGYVVLHALVTFADGRQRTTMPRRVLVRVPPVSEVNKADTIVAWGGGGLDALAPLNLFGVRSVVGGNQHALALLADGTVVAWGYNSGGQLDVPAGLSDVTAIAAAQDVSGAVKGDGTVVLWGSAESGPVNKGGLLTLPPGLRAVRQLALSSGHALALKADGTVVAWGKNNNGQVDVPAGLKDVIAVAASSALSVALRADGTVVTWGVNTGVPPAGLKNAIAISAGVGCLALKEDGTVAAWASNNLYNQVSVPPGLSGVVGIKMGGSYGLALKADGSVVGWGNASTPPSAIAPGVVPRLPFSRAIAGTGSVGLALSGPQLSITTQPQPQLARAGDYVEVSVGAAGAAAFSYQWRKDGVAIIGATANPLVLSSAKPGDSGNYDLVISDGGNYAVSRVAALVVTTLSNTSVARLSNVSIRNRAGVGDQTLIVGFAVGGGAGGTKPLLIRGAGPALAGFGLSGALTDPKLELFNANAVKISENDNWNGNAQIVSAGLQVGAFPFGVTTSKDAALYSAATPTGGYSVQITGVGGATGTALAEIYDATPLTEITAATPRLTNVSARAQCGTGADILIAGFVIAGTSPKTVLIRAVGPTLADYKVSGALADPKLELFSGGSKLADNDDWGGTTILTAVFGQTGAFALNTTSKDAALLMTLPPGSYSAQVSGVGGTTGVALVEIYEVP